VLKWLQALLENLNKSKQEIPFTFTLKSCCNLRKKNKLYLPKASFFQVVNSIAAGQSLVEPQVLKMHLF